jgi:hypothetical protein
VRRRAAGSLALLATLWAATSCLDITSSVPSIASITPVILPLPSVVVGDSSRDTAGAFAPLRLIVFGPNGNPLSASDVIVKFYAVDSTRKLFVDSLTGMAFGDSLSPNAGVVAQVRQVNGVGGFIQTNVVSFPVVPKPDSATRSADTAFAFNGTVSATDTLSTGLLSLPLAVTVHGNGDTLVQKYVVKYQIIQQPPTRPGGGGPSVVLRGNGADSNVAVTNASGLASLQIRVRPQAIPQDVQAGQKTDTVKVLVTVLYKGAALIISPSDTFTIPITGTIATP